MNNPCAQRINCLCPDQPGIAYDAELAEVAEFISTGYAQVIPKLGNSSWQQITCMEFGSSPISQLAADNDAYQQALLCALGLLNPNPNIPVPTIFFNSPQTCSVNCPDGTPFAFTVPAGSFIGTSQADADTQASSYACQQAAQRQICMSDVVPNTALTGNGYTGTITASGGFLAAPPATNLWSLVGGSLPPGLTFNGGHIAGNTATITGIPTAVGTYTFAIEVTDPSGDTITKTFTITVSCGISVVVTGNSMAMTAFPANPGYTNTIANGSLALGVNEVTMQFFSPTPKTWTIQAAYCVSGGGLVSGPPFFSINGVHQSLGVLSASCVGTTNLTFTTNDCNTPVTVVFHIFVNAHTVAASINWIQPT